MVDLVEANSGIDHLRQRFVARVCTPQEQVLIKNSDNPNITLWSIWAAKEAAFKIALRRNVNTPFIKHNFTVEDAPQCDGEHHSTIQFQDMAISIQWTIREDAIHCVGVWPPNDISLDAVTSSICLEDDVALAEVELTEREKHSVRSDTSLKVRQLAKKLLSERGFSDIEIIRKQEPERWRAPRLWRGDEELVYSAISLSHHGRFVAAAVWLP